MILARIIITYLAPNKTNGVFTICTKIACAAMIHVQTQGSLYTRFVNAG